MNSVLQARLAQLGERPPGTTRRGRSLTLQMSPIELDEAIISGNELLLDAAGRFVVRSAAEVDTLPRSWLQAWCVKMGVYSVPTAELIDWLRTVIGGRSAIDIAAGHGAIGRSLQIPTTDARTADRPEYARHYVEIGQPPPWVPPDVETLEASEAVETYRPAVVICAWGTQRWEPGLRLGHVLGLDERAILSRVSTYVHIGARGLHPHNRLPKPDEVIRPPWLRSRSSVPDDVICVWNRRAAQGGSDG